jgi:hypothetical protein
MYGQVSTTTIGLVSRIKSGKYTAVDLASKVEACLCVKKDTHNAHDLNVQHDTAVWGVYIQFG